MIVHRHFQDNIRLRTIYASDKDSDTICHASIYLIDLKQIRHKPCHIF